MMEENTKRGANIRRVIELSKTNVEQDVCLGRKTGVEENIKLDIIVPLIKCLGYTRPKDRDFEHPIKRKRADIVLMVDRKPKVIVEVKSLEKTLDAHKVQALGYAHNKGIKWVILTNGKVIQLYRSFIEGIDIERNKPIFETSLFDLPKNFRELFGYVGISNIRKIDIKAEQKVEEIKRSITEEDLLNTLKGSKMLLSIDIKEKFEKRYNEDEKFKNAIDYWIKEQKISDENWMDNLCEEGAYSIINRILFLRICADRGSIKPQITDEWIDRVESAQFSEAVTNLLEVVFGDIGRKFRGVYDAPLFDGIYFRDWEWNKEIIADIAKKLKKYDFRKISRDIIGHVYEKHIDRETRRRLGQFYTPDVIIDYILKNVRITPEKRIIDPSCGSGGFLIRAYDILKKQMEREWEENIIHKNILENNLYGVDINPFASQLTVMNLLLKNLEAEVGDVNVVTGNSLITFGMIAAHFPTKKSLSEVEGKGEGKEITLAGLLNEKFDCIVGNPPYVNISKSDETYKTIMPHYKDVTKGIVNSSTLFIKRGLDLLTDDGMLGFIIPKSILRVDSYALIRKYMLNTCEIKSIVDVGRAFEGVGYEQIIIILKKQSDRKSRDENLITIITEIKDLQNKKYKTHRIRQKLFNYTGIFSIYLDYNIAPMVNKINRDCKKLSEISDIFRGLGISKNKEFMLDKRENVSDEKILRGKGIGRYKTKFYMYLDTRHEEVKKYEKAMIRLKPGKIVAQNIVTSKVRIVSTCDEEGHLNIDTITNILLTDTNFMDKYVLALLNSKLMTFYIRDVIFNKAVLTMHLDAPYIGKLPIKKCPKYKQQEFADLVDKMLSLNEKLNDLNEKVGKANKLESEYYDLVKERDDAKKEIDEIDNLIDEKVYKLYGLNEKEIRMIESF